MTSTETAIWTAEPYYPLPVLRDNNYFATVHRNRQGYWWDVDDNYGDGEIIGNGLCATEPGAQAAAEKAIREHLDSVIAGAKAVEAAYAALHSTLVDNPRETVPGQLADTFSNLDDWMAGYVEGVEHALGTLATGGPKATAFLTALRNHQA